MVVVENGRRHIGGNIKTTVRSSLQAEARRKLFVAPAGEPSRWNRTGQGGTLDSNRVWIAGIVVGCLALAGCSLLQPEAPTYRYWEPSLSPDGGRIVYAAPVGEAFELFVRDQETGEETHLTRNGAVNWSPSWSPDGTRLVFVSQRDDNIDLYVIDLGSGEETRLTTHEKEDLNPDWGSDGRILFNSSRSEQWELYAVDPDGGNLVRLTVTPPEQP